MWNFAQNASNENFNNLLSFLVYTNILKISSARKYKFHKDYDPTAQWVATVTAFMLLDFIVLLLAVTLAQDISIYNYKSITYLKKKLNESIKVVIWALNV